MLSFFFLLYRDYPPISRVDGPPSAVSSLTVGSTVVKLPICIADHSATYFLQPRLLTAVSTLPCLIFPISLDPDPLLPILSPPLHDPRASPGRFLHYFPRSLFAPFQLFPFYTFLLSSISSSSYSTSTLSFFFVVSFAIRSLVSHHSVLFAGLVAGT